MSRMNWDRVTAENKAKSHGFERLSRPRRGKVVQCSGTSSKLTTFTTGQKCPFCNGEAVRRLSKYGPFLGCKRYPECSATRNLTKGGLPEGPWKLRKSRAPRSIIPLQTAA